MKYKTKLCLIAAVGTAFCAVCLGGELAGRTPLFSLERPAYGEGDEDRELTVEIGGESYSFDLTLQELPLSESDAQEALQNAAEGLESLLLKSNADPEHIETDLYMPSTFPESGVGIQWYLDSWEYIDPDGTVKNERLSEPVSVDVQAVLTLEGQSLNWERTLTLQPPGEPDEEQKLRALQYELQTLQEEGEETLSLPTDVYGEEITWYAAAGKRWIWIALLTLCALCAVIAGRREEEEKLRKERERSMQLDYPEIVSRLSLYMGAGISTRKAWERIVESSAPESGKGKKRKKKERRQYAYEEMRTTLYEMQSGVPEALAYERFGTRCRIPAYLKLGTLLSQNLRRGTKNLSGLLKEESAEAFEERKALARRMGEECESRLLFPMLLMLLTVLVMIMYPSIVSFQM